MIFKRLRLGATFDIDKKPKIPQASKGRKRFNELVDVAHRKLLKLRNKKS